VASAVAETGAVAAVAVVAETGAAVAVEWAASAAADSAVVSNSQPYYQIKERPVQMSRSFYFISVKV
jgi:hypothetical protein